MISKSSLPVKFKLNFNKLIFAILPMLEFWGCNFDFISNNPKLKVLGTNYNNLTSLDLSNNNNLAWISAKGNHFSQTNIDSILTGVLTNLNKNRINKGELYLNLQNPIAPPSEEGQTAKNSIIYNFDWTVITD